MSFNLNTPFVFEPLPMLVCAGQPDPEGFRQAAAAGLAGVVNLRPDAEMDWDEAGLLAELGVDYLQIPVSSPNDLSQQNARILWDWLEAHRDQQVMVHCASSNRVGALLALGHFLAQGDHEEALELGRAAGLTKMEPMVVQILRQWSA